MQDGKLLFLHAVRDTFEVYKGLKNICHPENYTSLPNLKTLRSLWKLQCSQIYQIYLKVCLFHFFKLFGKLSIYTGAIHS